MKISHLVPALACSGSLLIGSLQAAERTLQFETLPAPVKNTAKGVIGNGTIVKSSAETEKGIVYKVQYKMGTKIFEVEISPDGKIFENGEIIDVANTPVPVRKTIEEKIKNAQYFRVEKTRRHDKDFFIIEGSFSGKEDTKITINSEGKVISEEHEH